MKPGCLVLETGEVFKGFFSGEKAQAGELVFNTSHTGYEEMATDPSYYNQILIVTAPMQGNYGASKGIWESDHFWIKGFVCLEMQNSQRDNKWLAQLASQKVPVLSSVDTRSLVLRLRRKGVVWGALAPLSKDSFKQALSLIKEEKSKSGDWTQSVCVQSPKEFKGQKKKGLRLALLDFGYKKNILKEMLKRSEKVCVFPSHSSFSDVKSWSPDAIVLSNGPGDPKEVVSGVRLVQQFLSWKAIFGICMGHQVLAQALGAKTYKLKFGHRGSNHPIQDQILNRIYISAQNHGYAVKESSLPHNVQVSHINLNDKTVAGIYSEELKCLGVQFHPENCPGPREALSLFDFFINKMVKSSQVKRAFKKKINPEKKRMSRAD